MPAKRLTFGPFEADLASGELWRNGAVVPIQDLPFRLLAALLARPGQLVTRSELTAALWGSETFVDAVAGLNTAVAKLREALDDDADHPSFIETVPKRGYRFTGEVRPSASEIPGPEPATERRAGTARMLAWIAAALACLAIVSFAAFQLRADRGRIRVAVVLFDNETNDPALTPFAQGLTDAAVAELTTDRRLAVIGNAAVLRTPRPFRDIEKVRDALNADYIVIGQVQSRDGGTIVRAHLIRARDQSHVWVGAAAMTEAGEAAVQAEIAHRIRAALSKLVS
jgi:DNA-binding winged helix-turn-helix (wHTH) protein/TolB-like protein